MTLHRWEKPTRESLANHQYFADFKAEQSRTDDYIKVYRGLGDDGLPDPKISASGSIRGSILAKLSLSNAAPRPSPKVDQRGLLATEVSVDVDSSDQEQEMVQICNLPGVEREESHL